MTRILVVDDKPMMRDSVASMLLRGGFQPIAADCGRAALALIERHRPVAIITDLKMPAMDGLTLLREIQFIAPRLPVILMTAYATLETAVDALKLGAFDYIRKPFDGDELLCAVRRAIHHEGRFGSDASEPHTASRDSMRRELVGASCAVQDLRRQIAQFAVSDAAVLITGESGTGKELVAHAVHQLSARRDRTMLCLNCAALSEALLESELFGHERGAFTGADQARKGRFELADGGTLLLDEVSEISPRVQAKLLRVLQEGAFEKVGSSLTVRTDVRVIATSNRDLAAAVAAGEFRQDLFFRLNVLPLHVPPLRERREDIEELAGHFFDRQSEIDRRPVRRLSREALSLLRRHDWPGNVRELENICKRLCVTSPASTIDGDAIRPWLDQSPAFSSFRIEARTLEEIERETIVQTLTKFDGHRERTATALGIGVRTLGLKLKKWKEQNLIAASL